MRARGAAALVAAALVAGSCSGASAPSSGATEEGAGAAYRADERVAVLLAPCASTQYYDRDLSDPVPVLVEKLRTGYTEQLQRSKDELAALGDDAMLEVRRLAERWYNDPVGSSYAQNALDVAALSDSPLARDVLLRFLDHPRELLRRTALSGLARRHARPEDFDRLWLQLEAESANVQRFILPALYGADRERAEELFLGWIEFLTHSPLLPEVAVYVAASSLEETHARAAELAPQAPPALRPFVAAAGARGGSDACRELLRRDLADADDVQRLRAVQAAGLAGDQDPALFALAHDPAAAVRRAAAQALAQAAALPGFEPSAAWRARLREALGDEDREVRLVALRALVARGDAEACERSVALLDGSTTDLEDAFHAAAERWAEDPELARRSFERLRARDESAARSGAEPKTRLSVWKLIGSVPGEASARYLREVGLALGGRVGGLRAHQLLMIHASNSGERGRAFLHGELERETDPLRRLDLLQASATHRTDGARERLSDFVVRDDVSRYEVLYAADLLARLGPTSEAGPLLKRVCYRVEQDDVRLALRCLMWRWY